MFLSIDKIGHPSCSYYQLQEIKSIWLSCCYESLMKKSKLVQNLNGKAIQAATQSSKLNFFPIEEKEAKNAV
jgi:hypothetical protein